MEFAVASAMETNDSLKDGLDRGYFLPERVAPAQRLAERTIRCSTRFILLPETRGRASASSQAHAVHGSLNDEPRTMSEAVERRAKAPNDERSERTSSEAVERHVL